MNRNIIFTIIIFILSAVLIAAIFLRQRNIENFAFAEPVGVLKTTRNDILRANITSFMEAHGSKNDLGKDIYHCSNRLFGYDEKYVYALVYCSGFIIAENNEIKQGSAFSVPMRLEYKLPGYQIVKYEEPQDGARYSPTLRKLFPKEIYELNEIPPKRAVGEDNLMQEVLSKVIRN